MVLFGTLCGCIQYSELLLIPPDTSVSVYRNSSPHLLQKYDVLYIDLLNNQLPTPNRFEKASTTNLGSDKLTQFIQMGYPVDEEGYIAYPGISKTYVEGMTLKEATKKMETKLGEFINQPNLVLSLMNFQITVMGEVNQPGKFYFNSPRVTVLDALAKAGDLSSFADRRQIIIKREIQDSIYHLPFSLRQKDQVYLFQNDVVYVPPLKQKAILSQDPFQKIISYLSASLSIISFWIAVNN